MDSHELSTEASLYNAIEIKVDGKLYSVKRVTPKLLKEVAKHEAAALRGDPDAVVKQFSILMGIETKIVEELDIRDITIALARITKEILRPEEALRKAEKNASAPEVKP